jgi:hypothetical protein
MRIAANRVGNSTLQRSGGTSMPLSDGYGVVIGTLDHYQRDPINNYGQYYHDNLYVNTPAGTYHCAIDVDTKMTNDGTEWRVVPLVAAQMKGVATLADGWQSLRSDDQSGALDYVRTAAFHRGCNILFFRFEVWLEELRRWFNHLLNPPWTAGSSVQALDVLEPLLDDSQRLFVFGEPFTYGGLGVHNVHQNQGDPAGSQWWAEDGVWQDGGTIIQKHDGSYVAFLGKFKTQAYNTDASGHPTP